MYVIKGPSAKYLLVASGKLVCCLFLGMKEKLSVVSNMLYRSIKPIMEAPSELEEYLVHTSGFS